MRDVWSKSDEDGNYPFGQNFSVNNRYDEKAFDLFFGVLKERIWKLFLKQCIIIFSNLKSVTETIVKRKSSIIFEGIYGQHAKEKMLRYRANLDLYSKYTIKHIGCIEKFLRG